MNRKTLDSFCEKGIVGLVLAALVFSALATGAVRPPEFVVVELLVAAAGILWMARIWLEPRRNRLLFPPVGGCLLLFLGYALFHYLRADVEYTARTEVLRLLVYALLFFVVLNNLHKSDWTQLALYVLVFTGVAIAIYGIVQVIAGVDHVWHFTRPEQYKGRGSGTFINPNHFAGFLGMLLPLCLASVLTGRISQPMRILLGYSALLLLGGVAVSMSRGGWASTSLALAAVIGVTAVGRFLGLLVEFGDDLRKSHFVRLADAHVDDLGAGVGLKHGIFGALDLFKLVDGRVFSVVDAADSFREQILNVAFGHCLFWKTALGQAVPSRAKLIREQRLCKPV